MKSLLLDRGAWDLVLDAEGNIAVCEEPYSIAQDVACACRTFKGELIYDVNDGVPYFSEILCPEKTGNVPTNDGSTRLRPKPRCRGSNG